MSIISIEPLKIAEEWKKGAEYKASIGGNGIFEQSKKNERFYVGNQWYGASVGKDKPLVRHNIIKRIGEYKMAVITSAPLSVNYSADGVPFSNDDKDRVNDLRQRMLNGETFKGIPDNIEFSTVAAALSDYFKTTAERVKLDKLKEEALRNAYISGTSVLFTYWDEAIETGLYADESRTKAIKGDIACEVLEIENIIFGDPNEDEVEKQPYIIIAQRRNVEDVKREARRNRLKDDEIIPDKGENISGGDMGESEPENSKRVTVYTKLYKEYDKDDSTFKVMAVRTTEKAYIRKPWCIRIKHYPIAKFDWERRKSCAYGESEITYLIPNQIAINKALTAAVWGLMLCGMPIMVVNDGAVPQTITNAPGQIIRSSAPEEYIGKEIYYVQPPQMAAQFQNFVNDLCNNSLSYSGANDAALGNGKPDNAAAIVQLREAATQPLQLYMNRFYDFVEDIARIWADFWINLYGKRSLRVEDENGVQYLPFDGERYKNMLLTARIDVGAATVYSEAATIATLDNLFKAQLLTPLQYLERIPTGMIPNKTGLIEEIKAQTPTAPNGEISDDELITALKNQSPQAYAKFVQMSPEQRMQALSEIRTQPGGAGQEQEMQSSEEIGDL